MFHSYLCSENKNYLRLLSPEIALETQYNFFKQYTSLQGTGSFSTRRQNVIKQNVDKIDLQIAAI